MHRGAIGCVFYVIFIIVVLPVFQILGKPALKMEVEVPVD